MAHLVERTPPKSDSRRNGGTADQFANPGNSNEYEETFIVYPSAKVGAVTRKRNQITVHLNSKCEENVSLVRTLLDDYDKKICAFREACAVQSQQTGVSQQDLDDFDVWQEGYLKQMLQFCKKVLEWISSPSLNENTDKEQLISPENVNNDEIGPEDSVSNTDGESSRTSSSSATSSARARLIEKKAKVKAEHVFFQEKLELEEKQRQLNIEMQQLKFKQDEEEIKVLESELSQLDFKSESRVRNAPKSPVLSNNNSNSKVLPNCLKFDRNTSNFFPTDLAAVLSKQNEISLAIVQSQERSLLPRHEPETFSGNDPTKYHSFMLAFKLMIEERCSNSADKFYFLEKYTSNSARELVSSCNNDDPSIAYHLAMKLLKQHFGNEYNIANAYLVKLENWPHIKNEDADALSELAIFLSGCENLMKSMSPLNQLNGPKEIRDIVRKLPFELRRKFRDLATGRIDADLDINFHLLVEFINKQSRILKIPLFGDIKDGSHKLKPESSLKFDKKKSFNTTVSNPDDHKKSKMCFQCKKTNHTLDCCKFFESKTYDERVKFIKEKGLCFGCLEEGHSSKGCFHRLTCITCNKKHPTILHIPNDYKRSNQNNQRKTVEVNEKCEAEKSNPEETKTENIKVCAVSANFFDGTFSKVMHPAVPVKVRVKGTSSFIQTYLGMDSFASDNFIDESLLSCLNAKGKRVNICLTTMQERRSVISSNMIEDLEVFSMDEKTQTTISSLYSRSEWPFNINDSPCYEDIQGFPHLRNIPFEFIHERIGILVGAKKTSMLVPLEIVLSPNEDGPFASRHKFGWALNGPTMSRGKTDEKSCHQLSINESEELNTMIKDLFSQDFVDQDNESIEPSINDMLWKDKVEQSLKRRPDGHFEIALPFKEDDVSFPSSYGLAKRRLISLKQRLLKDRDLFTEYGNFMHTMIESGFVEQVPDEELQTEHGKVWFLSHHSVRHKQKGKLRVVFDCSMKYQGVSLNDKLLSGPDLTNNLVGVLLRFRQGKVAVMGDIEKMYYQVKIPASDSDLLRFLWFPANDINLEAVQYRLLVHVFGARSSPSCANYALKKTSCTSGLHPDTQETIQRAFYVDDLMKSTHDEETAVNLLKDVCTTISEYGFNLTGFASNSRKVLDSIAENKLAKRLKNIDYSTEELPCERALGVKWKVETDVFGFEVKLFQQPCTKKGILSVIFSLYDPFSFSSPVIIPAKRIFQEACYLKLNWDEQLPEHLTKKWNLWLGSIRIIELYEVPRCFSGTLQNIKNVQLHIFCNGSETAYGAVAYFRFENEFSEVHASIVMAKTRMTHLNNSTLSTVPRIELNSARLAVQLKEKIVLEIEMKIGAIYYWSDSAVVLKYINSETGRFQRFVSNRVSYIRSHSSAEQRRFVPGALNPADLLSRGTTTEKFLSIKEWNEGPSFLKFPAAEWPNGKEFIDLSEDELEIKKCHHSKSTLQQPTAMDKLMNSLVKDSH